MLPNYLENIPVEQTSSFYNTDCFLFVCFFFYLQQRKSASDPLKIHIVSQARHNVPVCVQPRASRILLQGKMLTINNRPNYVIFPFVGQSPAFSK